MAERTVSEYLGLPYKRRVRLEAEDSGEEYFVAYIEEVDGVEADGADAVEAHTNLQSAFEDYLQAMIARGRAIPSPEVWPGESYVPPKKKWGIKVFRRAQTPEPSWDDVEASAGSVEEEERRVAFA